MLKILQARLQQQVNHEPQDIQAGFRKGRGTRDQIANIPWIIEKASEFQKNICFCVVDHVPGGLEPGNTPETGSGPGRPLKQGPDRRAGAAWPRRA